ITMSVTEDLRPEARTQPGNSDPHRARMLINGAWVDSLSGATLAVENPAKRRVIATIPRGDAADANGAVEAAAHASQLGARSRRATAADCCYLRAGRARAAAGAGLHRSRGPVQYQRGSDSS